MTKTELPVDSIEETDKVQCRAGKLDSGTVKRYAESYQANAILPPIVVFQEKGCERFVVADGHHRLAAAKQAGRTKIAVELHEGDEVAALEYAVGCNAGHGLPRTDGDLKTAFKRLRDTPELCEKYSTNQSRADLLKVALRTIERYEAEWKAANGQKPSRSGGKGGATDTVGSAKEPTGGTSKGSTLTDDHKRVAREAREPGSGWKKADEQAASAILDAVSNLGKAWEAATRPAQIHTKEAVQKTLSQIQ